MSGTADRVVALTDEQAAVVQQSIDACVLVTAGAGAGKTHTLVERIAVLAEHCAQNDTELLSLSFSRAAVRVLRARLKNRGELAVAVRSRTIDGWALELLTEFRPDQSWREVSFDKRIEAATELIEAGDADERYEHGLGHVLVDEVQDLVGVRRRLIQALLGRYTCGFTVVGDLAQSIYGFQITDAATRLHENGAFIRWLRGEFGSDLVELELSQNFRARTEEARTALPFGPVLRADVEGERDDPEAYEELRAKLWDVADQISELDDRTVLDTIAEYDRPAGILCRTNGEALRVAEILARHAVRTGFGASCTIAWCRGGSLTCSPTSHRRRRPSRRSATGPRPRGATRPRPGRRCDGWPAAVVPSTCGGCPRSWPLDGCPKRSPTGPR
jgi:hypothetical protein